MVVLTGIHEKLGVDSMKIMDTDLDWI